MLETLSEVVPAGVDARIEALLKTACEKDLKLVTAESG